MLGRLARRAGGIDGHLGNAAAGHAPPGRDPLQFLSVPLGTTAMFTLFVGSALALRHKREWHKRQTLFATMTMLAPAMARLDAQVMVSLGLPRLVLVPAVTFGFIAWACLYDWRRLGRAHSGIHRRRHCGTARVDTAQALDRIDARLAADRALDRRVRR